ncbi:MAG: hypothetical protein JRE16_03995 [Deltaproteobacteria bacterium]|jgi:hypothetical protein|nr:hypothetical protein [Deltaproteobacteria bacterium]MBW2520957.1 hypothetical protein [Deltaproteobacteria bacterium]
MTKTCFSLALLNICWFLVFTFSGVVSGELVSGPDLKGFKYDPNLSGEPSPAQRQTTQKLSITQRADQTNLNLENASPIVPYLGTGEKPSGSPKDMPPLPDDRKSSTLDKFHLETGVGVKVNPKAKINFGYRFDHPPSLIEGPSSTDSNNSGQFRFSLDIKLPD